MRVESREEAWRVIDKIFPTGYVQDEPLSKREGYPVYAPAQAYKEEYQFWKITDLKSRLAVNDGIHTRNIWIKEELMTATVIHCKVTMTAGEFEEYKINDLVSVQYTGGRLIMEYLDLNDDTVRTIIYQNDDTERITIYQNGNDVVVKIEK